MFTEAIFVLPASINIEYLWFMLGAAFIFFSPLSSTPLVVLFFVFCIISFLYNHLAVCVHNDWCAFTDSSKLCTVWPWAHGSVDGGFEAPLWLQVTRLPTSPSKVSLCHGSNWCAFCVYHGNYCIFQTPPLPSPQSNKIWNNLCSLISRSLSNTLWFKSHSLSKCFCSYCV